MIKSIRFLEEIQKLDLEIKAIEGEEKDYLGQIDQAGEDLKTAEVEAERLRKEAEELDAVLKEAEEKIRQSVEKITKDEKRLNGIKNDKELNALNKEISAANKAKKQGEDEKSAHDSKLSEKKKNLEAKDAGLKEKASAFEALQQGLGKKKALWQEAVGERLKARESLKASIKPDILRKYEAIKSKRGGMGIALVKGETCQGCYIHIPPQVYIQLKRGSEEIISCPHCTRILYVENQAQTEAV